MKKSPRDKSLGAQMSIALQLMRKVNHKALAEVGSKITMEQLAILEVLMIYGEINMTELSNAVWKQNANITRIVDKLEKQNLVERKPVENDRRAYLISITSDGKKLFKDLIPVVKTTYTESVSVLSKEEIAITMKAIKKIIKHLS